MFKKINNFIFKKKNAKLFIILNIFKFFNLILNIIYFYINGLNFSFKSFNKNFLFLTNKFKRNYFLKK